MHHLLRRVRAAHLLALLALPVAFAGTATAAIVITGADVRDGSLTGADLAASSIGARELQARAVAPAPLVTFQDVEPNDLLFPGRPPQTVAELALPGGTYLVGATASLESQGGATNVSCALTVPGREVATATVTVAGDLADRAEQVALQRLVTTPGGALELACTAGSAPVVAVRDIALTALQTRRGRVVP